MKLQNVPYAIFIDLIKRHLQERGIGIINASPIAMGLLSNRGPPDWHPATKDIKDACAKAASSCRVRVFLSYFTAY